MLGIERLAGLEHAEAQVQQLAHRGDDDLLGLEPALVLQALALLWCTEAGERSATLVP